MIGEGQREKERNREREKERERVHLVDYRIKRRFFFDENEKLKVERRFMF